MPIDTHEPVEAQTPLARCQFSLRSLLLLVTACSVLFATLWTCGITTAALVLSCCLLVGAGVVADMIDSFIIAVSRRGRLYVNGHSKRVVAHPQAVELDEAKAEWIMAHQKLISDLREIEQNAEDRYDNAAGTLEEVLRSRAVCLLAEIDLERQQTANHQTMISKPR